MEQLPQKAKESGEQQQPMTQKKEECHIQRRRNQRSQEETGQKAVRRPTSISEQEARITIKTKPIGRYEY